MFVTTNGPARDPDTKTRLSDLLHFITDLLLGHMTRVDQSNGCSSSHSSFTSYPVYNSQLPVKMATLKSYQSNMDRDALRSSGVSECSPDEEILELKNYQGVYFNRLFQTANVTLKPNTGNSSSTNTHFCTTKTEKDGNFVLNLVIGQRFSGILIPINKTHFEMEPTGIFAFSARPEENKVSRMPVEFSNFDSGGIPHHLAAVWQVDEVIVFGREKSQACVADPPSKAAQDFLLEDKQIVIFIVIVIHLQIL